jgi:hypothetical protein
MIGSNVDTGLEVLADPHPLSDWGEALALLDHRATFSLRWVIDHYEIAGRDNFRIRGSPAGTNGLDVLVRHECELAGQWPTMQSSLNDYVAPVEYGHDPPF